VEVLAFEEDPHPAGVFGEAGHLGDRAGSPDVVAQEALEFGVEGRVVLHRLPAVSEVLERCDERVGYESPAEFPEVGALEFAEVHGRAALSAGWEPAATMSATAVLGLPCVTRASPTSTASAPRRSQSRTSWGPRTPDSATLSTFAGMSGASSANTSRFTSRVCRLRALTPMIFAPASTARCTSSAVWASTSAVIPREFTRSRSPSRAGCSRAATMRSTRSAPWARASQTW